MHKASVKYLLKILFWLSLPALGIAIAVSWKWATQSSLFTGQYGSEIAWACAGAFVIATIIGLQRYIIWAERRRIKRLLGSSIRRSTVNQPDD
ncbi:hypothetical protein [uncultured Umboniibacter sp.]|uniref:hypothetical protein n=1 Tax=uncultured Umboniibacter sp. TaxID=1798917 RepID=UPI00260BD17E|nr:hypothetical protein [uncultured Umboniibacter sp.]